MANLHHAASESSPLLQALKKATSLTVSTTILSPIKKSEIRPEEEVISTISMASLINNNKRKRVESREEKDDDEIFDMEVTKSASGTPHFGNYTIKDDLLIPSKDISHSLISSRPAFDIKDDLLIPSHTKTIASLDLIGNTSMDFGLDYFTDELDNDAELLDHAFDLHADDMISSHLHHLPIIDNNHTIGGHRHENNNSSNTNNNHNRNNIDNSNANRVVGVGKGKRIIVGGGGAVISSNNSSNNNSNYSNVVRDEKEEEEDEMDDDEEKERKNKRRRRERRKKEGVRGSGRMESVVNLDEEEEEEEREEEDPDDNEEYYISEDDLMIKRSKGKKIISKSDRGNYTCGKCGELKKGHICKIGVSNSNRNGICVEIQAEIDPLMTVREMKKDSLWWSKDYLLSASVKKKNSKGI